MNCARLNQVLDAWVDGELDAATSADIRHHVEGCPACAALEAQRAELSRVVREALPYHRAPPELHARVSAGIARESAPPVARRRPTWTQAFAIAACAAIVSALVTFGVMQSAADDPLREQVVASHVASLAEPQRLLSVSSGERHTVKPWFQGKVDFAPAVKDLSDAGFVLLGGRVDHVGERQAAAVVYRIRNHVINLFVWRADAPSGALTEERSRGFSIATWTEDGLRYAAISDVDPRDLRRFAELVRPR